MIPRYIVSCPTPYAEGQYEGFAVYVHDRALNKTWLYAVHRHKHNACSVGRELALRTEEQWENTPYRGKELPS